MDKIIQISAVPASADFHGQDIYGLSENGNLFCLRGLKWELICESPSIKVED